MIRHGQRATIWGFSLVYATLARRRIGVFRYTSLAFKNTLRNKRRSFLTISSIAVSLCLLGILLAIYNALFHSVATPGQALRLVVRHKVSLAQPIPASYEEKVRRVPGVKEVTPWNWYGGTYKDNRDQKNFFARFGVDPARFFTIRTQLEMPADQKQAFLSLRTGCIVSKDLAESLGFKIGDRIVLQGDIYPGTLDLKVVGIFEDPDAAQSLFFNIGYLRDTLPRRLAAVSIRRSRFSRTARKTYQESRKLLTRCSRTRRRRRRPSPNSSSR